jgi:hypothetical protein
MSRWKIVLLALWTVFFAGAASAQDAVALLERHAALRQQLAASPFGRPLHLEFSQDASRRTGEIFAVFDQAFGTLGPALEGAARWCDILILHLNVKHCEASGTAGRPVLAVMIGRKHDQPLEDAYRLSFAYRTRSSSNDYLQVVLEAPSGPMGTKDYRLALEAAPLDARRSFLHLSYSYAYGMAARVAMEA